MKKILIFYASYGGGHLSAAKSIQECLETSYTNIQIEVIDCIKYINRMLNKVTTGAYNEMAKDVPNLWGKVYAGSQKGILSNVSKETNKLMARKLFKLIIEYKPDLIISTHPFSSQMVSYLKKKGHLDCELATILTDFSMHTQWLIGNEYGDYFFVANDKMKEQLINYGVKREKIHVTGIPLSSKFKRKIDNKETYRMFNLNPERKTILFFGGGEFGLGKERTVQILDSLIRNVPDYQIVAISGKNEKMKKKFEEINVKGTQSVIDFCLNTKKRLLHVSTISVSGNGEKEETVIETPENINDKKIFKESDIYVGQNIKGVYSTTKFRAELLVLEAISSKGLDAQILRLGNITNRYSDGVFQMNTDENAFAKRIKSFIEIGAFPNYLLPHSIELTPVDLAAEAIVKAANYTSYCNVLHIYNNNLLPIKLFIETLSELGINLLPVPEKMMTDIITGILADNNRKDILSGIIYDLNENKQLVYTSRIRLNSSFTESFLERIKFNWKSIDKDYIIRYINYLRKIKFIK